VTVNGTYRRWLPGSTNADMHFLDRDGGRAFGERGHSTDEQFLP
jgi:hypothetical protein